ncbi:hypothetical protein L873DRAFT_1705425, partial [Choiromyces venosus 120613-1]
EKEKMLENDMQEGQKQIILIIHDESTFNANDTHHHSWQSRTATFLQSKSKSRGIMLSDVLFPYGRLIVSNSVTAKKIIVNILDAKNRLATMFFNYGKNNEWYWTVDYLVKHIIKIVISMFELCFPNSNT